MGLSFLTYCMKEIDEEATDLQRQVFIHLGLKPPDLIRLPNGLHEGGWTQMLNVVHNWIAAQPDLILICDVDCIPLNRQIIEDVYLPAMRGGAVIGPAQNYPLNANPTDKLRSPYAGPAMLGLSAETYNKLGKPPFQDRLPHWDVCEMFSMMARQNRVPLILLPPTSADSIAWCLYDDKPAYGPGTIYAGSIYHGMFGRCGTGRFKNKCKEVLGIK